MTVKKQSNLTFFTGGGEMGELMRGKDWRTTAVGPPEQWPQSLRTAVNLLLNSQFPMFIWWGDELITFYNDAYKIIAGEKHPALLGESGKKAWKEIWNDLNPLVNSVFSGVSTWSEDQLLYINRYGYTEETYFTFSYSPIFEESGAVSGLFCACIETTEKVLATRKIQESERNLRNTVLQAPVAMCILKGSNFTVDIANARMFELWGRESDKMLHRPIFDGLPEVRYQGLEELLSDVFTTGKTYTASERPVQLPRNNSIETVFVNFVYEPFRAGDGSISGVLAVAIDVTEQVVSRRKIEQSEAHTRLAVAAARMGTYEIDLLQQQITYSPRVAEIFCFDPQTPVPYQTFIDAVHPSDVSVRNKAHEEAKQTGELFYEVRILCPDASTRWIRLNGNFMFKDGVPNSLVGTVMDITEEKKAAELLEQKIQERTKELKGVNEQLQQFAYAASHDLQEPLRKVTFFLDRLMNNIGPGLSEENKRIADRIQHTTTRMKALIDDLLNYSDTSLGVMGFEAVDLTSVVKDVLDDMEATIVTKKAKINVQPLPVVRGDKRQLRQIFQNLISNALKYHQKEIPPRIDINSTVIKGADKAAYIPQERQNDAFYELEVKDNGIGFAPEDAKRIFSLFQRLHGKSEYEGTGIGLAIVQKGIQNHNGFVWAESTPGEGAAFKLLLPV